VTKLQGALQSQPPDVLIDTPVWSLALRRERQHLSVTEITVTETLSALIAAGNARIIGVVRQELLSGLRQPAECDRLRVHLRTFEEPRLEIADYEEAAQMYNRRRSRGIVGSLIDLLVCSVAHRRSWRIFTLDRDFERYARILGVQLIP
jgi:predicted nucleic acid-binding protein